MSLGQDQDAAEATQQQFTAHGATVGQSPASSSPQCNVTSSTEKSCCVEP